MRLHYTDRFRRSYVSAPTSVRRAFDRRVAFWSRISVTPRSAPRNTTRPMTSGKPVSTTRGAFISRLRETPTSSWISCRTRNNRGLPLRQKLRGRAQNVAQVLAHPDQVCQSRQDRAVFLYYRMDQQRLLCAVVKCLNGEGFLIIAYPCDTIKEGDRIWPTSESSTIRSERP